MYKSDFALKIFTLEDILFNDFVYSISIPGSLGQFTVLVNHEPLISDIEIGIVKIVQHAINNQVFIYKGFLEVNNTNLTIFADFAILIEKGTRKFIQNKIQSLKTMLTESDDELKNILDFRIQRYNIALNFIH